MNHDGHNAHNVVPAEVERLARAVVDAAFKVHRALGPGLLESAYEHCLAYELHANGVPFGRQVELPVMYEGLKINAGYRLDFLVGGLLIVEIKAVEALSRLHEAQILTYLKLSSRRLGLLMNFNTSLFKDGLRRLAL